MKPFVTIYKLIFFLFFSLFLGNFAFSQGYIDCATIINANANWVYSDDSHSKTQNGYTYFAVGYNHDPAYPPSFPIINGNPHNPANHSNFNGEDIYIAIWDTNCNQIFGTFIGGNDNDVVKSLDLDSEGNLLITGSTESLDFPTTDGTSQVGGAEDDVFLLKYAPDGTLLFSTVFGSSDGFDSSNQILADGTDIYIYGAANGLDFPTTDGTTSNNTSDNFLRKYDENGNLVYSTLLGGDNSEWDEEFTILNNGGVAVTGRTNSSNFPTTDGSSRSGSIDGYLTFFDANGNITYSTLIGGFGLTRDTRIEFGGQYVYLAGETDNGFFTTDGSTYSGAADIFVRKYDLLGNLIFSTYLGGSRRDDIVDIKVLNGTIYLYGTTSSPDYPIVNGVSHNGGTDRDILLTKLNSDGNIIYSTTYGGVYSDTGGPSFYVNASDEIYIISKTDGNPPTTDGSTGEGINLIKFNSDGSLCAATVLPIETYDIYFNTGFEVVGDTVWFLAGVLSGYSTDGTNSNYSSNGNVDLMLGKYVFCPSPTTISSDVLTPSNINVCQNGVVEQIIGEELVIDGSSFPLIYDNGILGPQPDVELNYQWQVSDLPSGPWSDILGALGTRKNYSPPPTVVDKYYRRLGKTSECCGGAIVSTSSTVSVLVSANTAPTVDAGGVYYICPGNSVTIGGSPAASGGTPAYNYNWNDGAYNIAQPTFSPTQSGVYTLEVSDANGCMQTDQATVIVYAATAGEDVGFCAGSGIKIGGPALQGVTILSSGGTPPSGQYSINYDWTPNDGTLSCLDCPNPIANPISLANYTLTTTLYAPDGSSCQTSDDINLRSIASPSNSNFAGADIVICLGEEVPLGFAPESLANYSISSVNQSSTGVSLATITNLSDGDYSTGGHTLDGENENITIDLGASEYINQLEFAALNGQIIDDRLYIAFSIDGVNWKEKINYVSGPSQSPTYYKFLPEYVRYIRLRSGASFRDVSISEFYASLNYQYTWAPGAYLTSSNVSSTTFDAGNIEMPLSNPITYTITANIGECNYFDQVTVAVIEADAGNDICGPGVLGGFDETPLINETYNWVKITDPLITIGTGDIIGATNVLNPTASASAGGNVGYELSVSYTLNGSTKICKDTVIVSAGCSPVCEIIAGDGINTCPSLGMGEPQMKAVPSDDASSNWTYSWTSNMGMVGLDSYNTQIVNLTDNVSRIYTVTFTNIIDPSITCTASISANSASYSTPSINVDSLITTCKDVSINIGDPSGNPGLTYSWTGADQLNNPNISYPEATVSATTNFQITATDNSTGCAVIEDVQVLVADAANAGPDLVVCDNGVVRLGVNTDEDGYNYSWEPVGANWQNGSTSNDMRPEVFVASYQQFILTATDTAGICTTKDTMEIIVEPLPPIFALPSLTFCPSQTESLVLGNSDGTSTGTNLVPNGYSYAWSSSNISDASIQNPTVTTPLPTTPITFEIQVIAPNGCAQKVIQTITPIITAPIVVNDQTICLGESIPLGSNANPTSGVTYTWSPITGLDDPFSPNPIFSSSIADTITFTVSKTSGGCITTADVTIMVDDFTAPVLIPQNMCEGSSVEIGVPNNSSYSYQWSPITGLDNPYISNPTFSGTNSTNFTLTVVNNQGCVSSTSTSVTVNSVSPVSVSLSDEIVCLNLESSIKLNPSISPPGNYAYQWNPSEFFNNPNIRNPTFYIPSLGNYILELELEVIDQTTGCSYIETSNVNVYVICEEICDNGIDDDGDGLVDCDDCLDCDSGVTASPTIDTEPSDLNIDCDTANQDAQITAWLNNNAGAIASDACSTVSWSHDYLPGDLSDLCGATGSVSVIFTAEDACGNTTNRTRDINVTDTTSPTIDTEPSDLNIDCDTANQDAQITTWLNNNAGAIASDLCSTVSWSHDYMPGDLSDLCGATGSISVIFTAEDACGNTTNRTRDVNVTDTTSPTIDTEPSDLNIDCDTANQDAQITTWLNNNAGAIASDLCSTVSWSHDYLPGDLSDLCGATGSVSVIFTAEDACGNTTNRTRDINVTDTTSPTIDTEPSDLNIDCDTANQDAQITTWLNNNAGAIASDACSTVSWSHDYLPGDLSDLCGATGSVSVIFTAEDACGNTTNRTRDINVTDTTSPTIDTEPSDLNIDCDTANQDAQITTWLNNNAGAIASDLCSTVSWSHDYLPGDLSDLCGATGSVSVIFTAEDACGNTTNRTRDINVTDTTSPTIDTEPSDLNIDCDTANQDAQITTWLNNNAGAIASDLCSTVSWSHDYLPGDLSDLCGATGSVSVIFTAEDACGNTTNRTRDINVTDTTSPTIDTEPSDLNIDCDTANQDAQITTWLNNNAGAIASDLCSTVSWSHDYMPGDLSDLCGATGSISVIFTAEDACGNTTNRTRDVNVTDTTSPTIDTEPSDLNIDCDTANQDAQITTWLNNNAGAIASDLCSTVSWSHDYLPGDLSDLCGATGSVSVIFTAEDACGNTTNRTRDINVTDTTSPTIDTEPSDLNIDCDTANQDAQITTWLNNNAGAIASDLCSTVSWSHDYLPGDLSDLCGATGSVSVIFTAEDACGNTTNRTRDINVTDTTSPTIDTEPSDLNIDCDTANQDAQITTWLNNNAGAIASDLCSTVSWSHDYLPGDLSDLCGATGSVSVIFTAEDACGNTTNRTRDINVTDTTSPTIDTEPSDLNIDCDTANQDAQITTWLNNNAGAIASDLCSTVSWSHDYLPGDLSDLCGATGSVSVIFTAEDACGNTTNRTRDINVTDTTSPTIDTEPSDLNIDCDTANQDAQITTWLNNNAGAIASDLCSTVSWSHDYMPGDLSDLCGATGSISVIFTAEDACGNTTNRTRDVNVTDTTSPTIDTEPSDLNIDCDTANQDAQITTWLNNNAGAIASDLCSTVSWSHDYLPGDLSDLCGATGSVSVIFTAEDACGNTTNRTRDINVTDTTSPTIDTEPSDLNIDCDTANQDAQITTWLNNNAGAIASDLCSTVSWSHDYLPGDLSDLCGATGSVSVIFTAEDACGNTTNRTRDINVTDTTSPTIDTEPSDLNIDCDTANQDAQITTWLNNNAGAIASDLCSTVSWSHDYLPGDLSDLCGATGSVSVIFTAEDACGNTTNRTRDINVTDTTSPTIDTEPSDLNIDCDTANQDAQITTWLNNNAGAIASDLCSTVSWSHDYMPGDLSDLCGATGSISVIFTAEDACGNTTNRTRDVNVTDTTSPTIDTEPSDLNIDCDTANQDAQITTWLNNNAGAIASDLCSTVSWSHDYLPGDLSDLCGATGSVSVIFTAEDACGNTTNRTRDINVTDTTSPTIDTEPSDLNIDCDTANQDAQITTWLNNNAGAIASDLCSTVSWSHDYLPGDLSDLCGATGSVSVIFTAEDACGNTTNRTRDINVTDTTSPTIDTEPSDLNIDCDTANQDAQITTWLNNNAGAIASDLCSTVSWSHDYLPGDLSDLCGATGSVSVIFTAEDACGNTTNRTRDINVTDTTSPTIDTEPSDLNIDCDTANQDAQITTWLNNNAGAIASDLCSTVSWSHDYLPGDLSDLCGATGSVSVIFTAEDACGNTTNRTRDINVTDTTSPTIDTEPSDLNIDCDTANQDAQITTWLNNNAGAIASDLCSTVSWSHDYLPGDLSDLCGATGSVSVIFTAEDACGNTTTRTRDINVTDTTSPTIDTEPSDLNIDCDTANQDAQITTWLNNNAGAIASDLCSTVSWSHDYLPGDLSDLCGATGSVSVIFTAEDACGNTTNRTRDVNVTDTTSPTIDTEPSDLNIDCDTANQDAQITTWLNNHAGAIASDLCSTVFWSHDYLPGDLSDLCGATGSVSVIFTAEDACGNTTSRTRDINVTDTTSPTIDTEPSDLNIDCDTANQDAQITAWLISNGGATASDECSSLTWSHDYLPGDLSDLCGATGSGNVIFTVEDACGNTTTRTGDINVTDTASPTIDTEPSDLNIDCDTANQDAQITTWLNNNAGAIASDACSAVSWSYDYLPGDLSDLCGATGSVSVIFTVEDACGNTTTRTRDINVTDTTSPTIDTEPSDLNIDCDTANQDAQITAWLISNGGATASDECSSLTWSHDYLPGDLSDLCGATGSGNVIFTVEDACGNTTTRTGTINVTDTTSPTIDTEPSDLNIDCDTANQDAQITTWLNNNAGAIASDACSTVSWSHDYLPGDLSDLCGATGSVSVIFTAEDACGNTTNRTRDINVTDTTSPTIDTEPSDLNIDCDTANQDAQITTWLNNNAGAIASDLCSTVSWSHDYMPGDLSDLCGATGSVSVIFTAEDACGNITNRTRDINVTDTTSPTIDTEPSDFNIDCDTANQDAQITTWLNNNAGAIASDLCSTVFWSHDYLPGDLSDLCGATGSVSVIFTAEDACGNTTNRTRDINVTDTTSPTIDTEPSDLNIDCDTGNQDAQITTWLANNGGALASDACSDVSWSHDYVPGDLSDLCGATGSVNVIFTVQDVCGNTTTRTRDINVTDNASPIIDVPSQDSTVQCNGSGNTTDYNTWLSNNGGAMASDVCGIVSWSHNAAPLSDECGATGTSIVTFTAIDECGNTAQSTATFTVEDSTPPTLDIPAQDITEECDGTGNIADYQAWLADNGGARASDDCSDVIWRFEAGVLSDDCGATGFVSVNFVATDDCGNSVVTIADFIIEDTKAPNLVTGAIDEIVECDGLGNTAALATWLGSNGSADANDDCSNVSWSNELISSVATCGQGSTREYQFTVSDECGNTEVTSANFIIEDRTNPTITVVAIDEIVECDGSGNIIAYQNWLTSSANAVATDDCGVLTWTYVESSFVPDCGLTGSTVVTFTVSDECDNSSVTSASFIIEDRTSPLIDIPATNQIVECDGSGNTVEYNNWLSTNGGASASEDCGTVSWSYNITPMTDECAITGTISVTFIAIDQCGNTDTSAAEFIIEDNVAPSFANVPQSVSVECNAIPALVLPEVSDDCDISITVTHSDNIISGSCPQEYTIVRTFIAIDACGNSTVDTQEINVSDNTLPVLANVPLDVTFECSNVPELGNAVIVSDNCDPNVQLVFDEQTIPGDCPQTYTRIRTWSATDACGNIVTASQNIFVQDVTSPVIFNAPTDLNIDCGQVAPPAPDLIVTDNCDAAPEITLNETNTLSNFDCTDSYTIERIWTVEDDCGNTVFATQTITVSGDPEPPVLANVPSDVTYECSNFPTLTDPVLATDNCDNNVEVVYIENTISSSCPQSFVLERTWIAIDDCGNSSVGNQRITVEDTTIPIMSNIPGDITISCGALPPAAPNVLASDNCDVNVSVVFVELTTNNTPDCTDNYSVTRTWAATDACGNSSVAEQIITVVGDDEAPVLANVPLSITVECSNFPALTDPVTATDNCDNNVGISLDSNIINGDCPDRYTLERTWTATDVCGNSAVAVQTILVEDNTAPVMSGVPTNLTITCGQLPPIAPSVIATDNCDPNVGVTFVENSTAPNIDCTVSYSITRTWEASDRCGNFITAEQIITIEGDDEAPVLASVPSDISVECSNLPTLNNPVTATDNCTANVDIQLTTNTIPGNCTDTYTINRVWVATDDCGNTITATQEINVADNTAPIMSNIPIDISINCGLSPPAVPTILATDNCDPNVVVTFAENNTATNIDCSVSYTITRTWEATDRCGNLSTGQQIITVSGDDEAPVLSATPGDLTLSCDIYTPNNVIVTAIDNCNANQQVVFNENIIPGACQDAYEVERTWTATDMCGNATVAIQNILVFDDVAPILVGVPIDEISQCGDNLNPNLPQLFATDNCDPNVFIQYAENTVPGACAGSYTTTRTWVATDRCGNSTISEQQVIVGDTEAPVFSNVPPDITIDCGGFPEMPDPFVTDNCVPDISFVYTSETIDGDCENSYTLIRTWTATDLCGNESSVSQEIFVTDGNEPIILNAPVDITVDLTLGETIPDPATIIAFDICDLTPEISIEEYTTSGCTYEIERTYIVTDNCDNTNSVTQIITVLGDLSISLDAAKTEICANEFIEIQATPIDSTYEYIWTSTGGEIINPLSDKIIFSADEQGVFTIDVLVISDNCQSTASIQITVGENELVEVFDNSPVCSGDTIIINVQGGNTWAWDGPDNFMASSQNIQIPDVTPINNGTYSVTVTSGTACESVFEVDINVGDELIPIISSNSPVCEGSTLELFATGGSFYYWTGPDGWTSDVQNPTIANLSLDPGIYLFMVEVSTFSGCQGVENIQVEVVESGDISVVNDMVLCAGERIELGANGGTGYLWTGPNGFTSNEQYPIIENSTVDMTGAYTVSISNTYNCIVEKVVQVEVNDCGCDTDAVLSLVSPENCDDGDGVAVFTPSAYTYAWPDNETASNRSDLEDGIYIVTVTDDQSCTEEMTIVIEETGNCDECVEPVIVDRLIISSTCGENTGSISLELQDDIQYYEFVWMTPTGTYTNFQNELLNLSEGVYNVTITDTRFADCILEEQIIVNNLDAPEPDDVTIMPSDCGLDNGQVVLMPVGLNYYWVDLAISGNEQMNLAAGDYVIEVSDPQTPNCIAMITVNVPEEGEIQSSYNVEAVPNCGASDGVVLITATDVLPSSMVWSNGFSGDRQTDLGSGYYEVYLTNISGCKDTLDFVLEDNIQSVDISIDQINNPVCSGDSDGSVDFTSTPALSTLLTHTFIIENSNGDTINNGNLAAGDYCLIVRDDNECIAGQECFTISTPSPLQVVVEAIVDCESGSSINLITSGGTGPYTYIWDDLDPINDSLSERDSLDQGSYDVSIIDANSCDLVVNDIIIDSCDEPCDGSFDLFTLNSDQLTVTDCENNAKYCLDIPVTDIDEYTFQLNGVEITQTTGCSYDSTYVYTYFSIPGAGIEGPYTLDNWTINGIDYSGEFTTMTELLALMNLFDPMGAWTIDSNILAIEGGDAVNDYGDIKITQNATGEYGLLDVNAKYVPFSVALELEEGLNSIIITQELSGCRDSIDVLLECLEYEVTPDTIEIFMELGADTTICLDPSELTTDIATIESYCEDISTEVVSYDITNDCINITAEFLGDDIGCFVYCDDSQICDTLVVFSIVVTEGAITPPIAMDDDTITLVNWHVFNFNISQNDTFNIETDSIIIIGLPSNGTVDLNSNLSIDYIPDEDFCGEVDSFTYMIVGEFGTDMATVYIDVLCEDLTIFNGFSPNGDGINDSFTITGIESFRNNTLIIFNRWGNQVYYKEGYSNEGGWDGTWQGRTLPDGTYFYVLDTGEGRDFSGYVQIHR